jgi:hypothetical protein
LILIKGGRSAVNRLFDPSLWRLAGDTAGDPTAAYLYRRKTAMIDGRCQAAALT